MWQLRGNPTSFTTKEGEHVFIFKTLKPYTEINISSDRLFEVEIKFWSRKHMKELCHSKSNIRLTKHGKIARMKLDEFFRLINDKMSNEDRFTIQKELYTRM